jgi:hypothetical protein
MNINDFTPITPETIQQRTEPELRFIMAVNQGGVWDNWAIAELARRQNDRLAQLINSLTDATNKVHQEVALLGSSSDRLEKLTKTLRNLTWVLIVVTVLLGAESVGIEVWKAYHERPGVATSQVPSP